MKLKLIGIAIFLIITNSHGEKIKNPSISVIVSERGGRVDWSFRNNLIVHSRYGKDGYYDVWIMKPDGSDAKCLTCIKKFPLHNGQPCWHPDGKYIVFQSQDPSFPHTKRIDYLFTQPGHGLHNNLWLMDIESKNFYQLTKIKFGQAILHPCFSPDGKRLMWSQKMGRGKFNWAIVIADFVEKPFPHLKNIRTYQPKGKVWYEAHDFSKDGKRILCTIGSGKKAYYGYDIWEMDIKTQKLKRLTFTPDVWDEHAHYSPDGKKICWVSSRTYKYIPERWAKTLKTELWIMNVDGSGKKKITHFNEPGYPEYTGERVIVSDNCWSPDGKKIAATVVKPQKGRSSSKIVIIHLPIQ
ncbi:MAG TPA: hypothetical protein ENG68_00870 [bacterium]|nr:hypothetical protein [bacterium]